MIATKNNYWPSQLEAATAERDHWKDLAYTMYDKFHLAEHDRVSLETEAVKLRKHRAGLWISTVVLAFIVFTRLI